MNKKIRIINSGTVTSPDCYMSGAIKANIKYKDKFDLGILYSTVPCVSAGVFTTNAIKSAPVVISKQHLRNSKSQAIVVNSGCANASTGDSGLSDARMMADLVAEKLKIRSTDVLVASTGVIGVMLPMDKVRSGIAKINFSRHSGNDFARAMMTTDTFPKELALTVETDEGEFKISGVAKGAGMIHPDMATMLCFITTDAAVKPGFLKTSLTKAVGDSFNMITVDGDTSPSDSVIVMANGSSEIVISENQNAGIFQDALNEICLYLAKSIARDGEGATKLIEVTVEGAKQQIHARKAARTVASSSLVKAAIHGSDPNWGRVVAALGRSKTKIIEKKIDVWLQNIRVLKNGYPEPFDKIELSNKLSGSKEIYIGINLNLGKERAVAWGCDLSEEYVTINSDYTT